MNITGISIITETQQSALGVNYAYHKQHKQLSFYRLYRVLQKNTNLKLNCLNSVVFPHTETEENSHSLLQGFFGLLSKTFWKEMFF